MAETPQYRNSAGRILAAISGIKGGLASQDWGRGLSGLPPMPDASLVSYYLSFAEIGKLYLDLLEDLNSSEIPEPTVNVLKRGLAELQSVMMPSGLNKQMPLPSEALKSVLEVCATMLPAEGEISPDELQEIKLIIEELSEITRSSSISPILKKSLLELIRLANDSIARYQVHGARGLKKAFKDMLGESADLFKRADAKTLEELEQSGAKQAIGKLLRVVDRIGSKALKYQPLLEPIVTRMLGA